MGVDAVIFFEATGELDLEREMPNGFVVSEAADWEKELGATHSIDTYSRYYGKGYERGSWPDICSVLMLLFACPNVKRVWYGGDSSDPPEISREQVNEISMHFMLHGERPYRSRF